MNQLRLRRVQSLKRHSEAFFIIAFIVADCFASGWVLTAGTVAAVLYVVVPGLRTLIVLSPVERITYLKAFVKTEKVQRLAFLLFWIYSIRLIVFAATTAMLLNKDGPKPTVSSALILGAQQFAPFAFVFAPVGIYAAACLVAIYLRSRLKATKEDPDLIKQRQKWCGMSHLLFLSSLIASILSITLNARGPGYMISNWLLASARDANLYDSQGMDPAVFGPNYCDVPFYLQSVDVGRNFAFVHFFDIFVLTALSLVAFALLLKPALRLNAFLNSFCWRVVSAKSLQNMIEGFLEALRLPSRNLTFKEAHPFMNNALRTLVWICACYAALFWLFGLCGGPLGLAIQNWLIASAVDAGLASSGDPPAWLFEPKYRFFMGSIVALYGTAPLAVTACVFLPCATARKIVLNCDGISFLQGPYISLLGRQFRLWSDLKKLSVKIRDAENFKADFTMEFRSGGRIKFNESQLSPQDLKVLLDSIDQYAAACAVDSEVYSFVHSVYEREHENAASDGITDSDIARIPANEFKSTIFVPFRSGELLPGTETRIIKLLSSKPLCAVYLARHSDGRMVTLKQFYLADETDETRALEKILRREYELLSGLDHPGIAKVVNSFFHDKSTFLVIEHRLGNDMRAIVTEHGARSETLTLAWAKELCEIMVYLHSRDPVIVHRDLTPDNVIVGEDGSLRLIDFGAAREFLEGITGTMLGKHCYVSPEQLRGEANVRSDIYSFGSTLYFLLTGRDPVALSQSSPAKSADCSEEIDQLIRDCTEFDEEKRPKSFAEVLDRLNQIDSRFVLKLAAREKVTA